MKEFQVEKVNAHTTRIYGLFGEYCYLLEGTEKALLIDTLSGIGSLKTLTDTLTAKPLTVVLTHGHIDHAMGAPEYLNAGIPVYMSELDKSIYKEDSDITKRKNSISDLSGGMLQNNADLGAMIPATGEETYSDLEEGMFFDLGGITVEAFSCPGHTPGSMVFLIKEDRALLLGDACNGFTFLFFDYCPSITRYKKNLEMLKEKTDSLYDSVYMSHGPGTVGKEMIDEVLKVCDDVILGKSDEIPFDFMGISCCIAKAMTPEMTRVDGGIGNIVYKKENIKEC